jgi:hypothetical protein
LYHIYWNIKVAEVLSRGRKGSNFLSIAIFRLLFSNKYLFFYLAGREGLPQVYKRIGYPKRRFDTIDCFRFFFPMAAAMIVQNDINKLYN